MGILCAGAASGLYIVYYFAFLLLALNLFLALVLLRRIRRDRTLPWLLRPDNRGALRAMGWFLFVPVAWRPGNVASGPSVARGDCAAASAYARAGLPLSLGQRRA